MSEKIEDPYYYIVNLLHEAVKLGQEIEKNPEMKNVAFAGDPIQMRFDTEIQAVIEQIKKDRVIQLTHIAHLNDEFVGANNRRYRLVEVKDESR